MCSKQLGAGVIAAIGVVLVAVGAGIGWGLFPQLVEDQISEKVPLKKENTDAWNNWQKLPIPMQFKVYFFEVTNPEGVHNGDKPVVREVGPYVYDEYRVKEEISISEDGTEVSYNQRTTYFFNQDLSGDRKDTDELTILNAALMGAILDGDLKDSLSTLTALNGVAQYVFADDNGNPPTNIFTTIRVKDVLFDGVPIRCEGAAGGPLIWGLFCRTFSGLPHPPSIRPDPDSANWLYSFFAHKNNSYDGRYTVLTGINNPREVGKIVRWNDKPTLSFWSGPGCNEIKGTDAAIFPPFLTKETRLDIFSTDLCRSLYAVYAEDMEHQGVPGYRFVAEEDQLGDIHDSPDNYCYCPNNAGCIQKGALDLYACLGANVILTFPHFYSGSPDYLARIDGLNPTKSKHQTFLDLEPNTGVPLRGGKRVQFNMQIKPVRKIPGLTGNLPSMLLPIMWVDEGLELDSANTQRIKDELLSRLSMLEGVRWGLIGVGIAGVVVGAALFFVWRRSSSGIALSN